MGMHHIDNLLNSRPEVIRERMIRALVNPHSDFHNLLKTYSEANFKEKHRSELRSCVLNTLEVLNLDIINIAIEGTCNPFLLAIEYVGPGLEPRRFESDIYVGISDLRAELIRRLQHDDDIVVSKLDDNSYIIGEPEPVVVSEPGFIGDARKIKEIKHPLKSMAEYDDYPHANDTVKPEGQTFPEVEMMPEGHQTEGEKKIAKRILDEEYRAESPDHRFERVYSGRTEEVSIERDADGKAIVHGEDGRVIRGGGDDEISDKVFSQEERQRIRLEEDRKALRNLEGKLIRNKIQISDAEVVTASDPAQYWFFLLKKLFEELGELQASDFNDIMEFVDVREVLDEIALLRGFSRERVNEAQIVKWRTHGTFSERRILLP